jgi:hypothetical protein
VVPFGGDAGDHDIDESLGPGFAGRWLGVVHLPDAGESEKEIVAGEVGSNRACLLVGREQGALADAGLLRDRPECYRVLL